MKTARDVLEAAHEVLPQTKVQDLAQVLLDQRLDGVVVVDADRRLVGVVTAMDLIYKEKRLHLPTFFYFLDAVIPLENPLRSLGEIEKIAGDTVEDIMTRDVEVVGPDTPLDEIASRMVDQHLTLLPVVEGGRVLGVVTKPGMLREAFRRG